MRLSAISAANKPVADPTPSAAAGGKANTAKALATVRVSFADVVGPGGTHLGGVVYADTFLPAGGGRVGTFHHVILQSKH